METLISDFWHEVSDSVPFHGLKDQQAHRSLLGKSYKIISDMVVCG